MAQRHTGSTLAFFGALVLGIATFALVMVVMGTRLDADVSPDPASSVEVERQNLAERSDAIAHSADSRIAAVSSTWTRALGGVWVPWPDGAPEGHTNPPPYTPGSDVHAELRELSARALRSSLGPVATSIGVSALALGATEPAHCGDYALAKVAASLSTGVSVKNIETARQWLQRHAATLPIGKRDAELTRIDTLSDLLDAQLAAGAPDTRPALATEPANKDYVASAYSLLINQLAFSATQAPAEGRRELASFVCHLALAPDAPSIDALPGIDPPK
ncbi:hypothetical protein QEV01_09575 [Trueperella pyogenes]|uniref:hypothetical protein n=1 Tax=Trueperella pyogenes TaxID=1661 RepID=UPI00324A8F31